LRSSKHIGSGGDACLENAACGVDEYERAQTVALVEQSLGQLNERYRTALVLKDLQGLPAEEIAEVLEVSRPTADVLVHRARGAFKSAFARLAGDVSAPASLAAVLVPLSLPAALHAMPMPASPTPAPHAPAAHAPVVPHHAPMPDPSSLAGPTTAGLLTKIGAALTTKAAIAAIAVTAVVGGGTVAVKEVQHSRAQRWQGSPGAARQSAPRKLSKQWARWSLYSHWIKSGWPSGWMSGRWRWDSGSSGGSWGGSSGGGW
jgi:hypothetical protein